MKKYVIIFIIIIAIGVSIGAIIMNKQNDSGQKEITKYEEYLDWIKKAQNEKNVEHHGIFSGGDTEEECKEFYTENREHFLSSSKGENKMMHGTFCAILVQAGDDYIPYDGTFEQNAIIKEVYQGCKYEKGTEISVIHMGGASVDSEGNVLLTTAYGLTPFIPGDTYLLFCEETELSYEMDKPQFRSLIGGMSYLNIKNNKVTVIEEDVSVEEILESEFIAGDSYSEKYLLDIKHEILENYGLLEEEEM